MKHNKHSRIMQTFTLRNIPSLDVCVLGSLEFFLNKKLPKINIPKGKRILVVGSGNALVTGKIIFADYDAVFADESTYKEKLKIIKFGEAVLISASGEKHAPIIAKALKKKRIKTTLLTTNKHSEANEFVSKSLIFPKQREPYTYNTSTYLSMIFSKTGESVKNVLNYLNKLKIPRNIGKYDTYYILLPEKYDSLREMFHTKFDELFGPKLQGEIFTFEQTKHAKTVVPSKKELFISIGKKNNNYGENRFNVKLPKNAGFAMIMAIGYYIIGYIQSKKPDYFKKNIAKYTKQASKLFGHEIKPIVE